MAVSDKTIQAEGLQICFKKNWEDFLLKLVKS